MLPPRAPPNTEVPEGDYFWAKEYRYTREDADANMMLMHFKDDAVTYAPFELRLRANKRRRINTSTEASTFSLRHREPTAEEAEQAEQRRAALVGESAQEAAGQDE